MFLLLGLLCYVVAIASSSIEHQHGRQRFHMALRAPSLGKRASSFIDANGYATNDARQAAVFHLADNRLYSNGLLISAATSDPFIIFSGASSTKNVSTTWSVASSGPVWRNSTFRNGAATYCQALDARVYIVLQTQPTACNPIVATTTPTPVSSSTPVPTVLTSRTPSVTLSTVPSLSSQPVSSPLPFSTVPSSTPNGISSTLSSSTKSLTLSSRASSSSSLSLSLSSTSQAVGSSSSSSSTSSISPLTPSPSLNLSSPTTDSSTMPSSTPSTSSLPSTPVSPFPSPSSSSSLFPNPSTLTSSSPSIGISTSSTVSSTLSSKGFTGTTSTTISSNTLSSSVPTSSTLSYSSLSSTTILSTLLSSSTLSTSQISTSSPISSNTSLAISSTTSSTIFSKISSITSSSTSSAASPVYFAAGCFNYGSLLNTQFFDNSYGAVDSCKANCNGANLVYVAQTYCGCASAFDQANSPPTKADDGNCVYPCRGNSSQLCGGANVFNLYILSSATSATAVPPTSTSSTPTPSSTFCPANDAIVYNDFESDDNIIACGSHFGYVAGQYTLSDVGDLAACTDLCARQRDEGSFPCVGTISSISGNNCTLLPVLSGNFTDQSDLQSSLVITTQNYASTPVCPDNTGSFYVSTFGDTYSFRCYQIYSRSAAISTSTNVSSALACAEQCSVLSGCLVTAFSNSNCAFFGDNTYISGNSNTTAMVKYGGDVPLCPFYDRKSYNLGNGDSYIIDCSHHFGAPQVQFVYGTGNPKACNSLCSTVRRNGSYACLGTLWQLSDSACLLLGSLSGNLTDNNFYTSWLVSAPGIVTSFTCPQYSGQTYISNGVRFSLRCSQNYSPESEIMKYSYPTGRFDQCVSQCASMNGSNGTTPCASVTSYVGICYLRATARYDASFDGVLTLVRLP